MAVTTRLKERTDEILEATRSGLGAPPRAVIGLAGFVAFFIVMVVVWGPRTEFPLDWSRGISRQINEGVETITVVWGPAFDLVSDAVLRFLLLIETAFLWTPWPVVVVGVAIIAWITVGWKFSVFGELALLTTGLFGLWDSAMETMALIVVSVFLSIVVGIPFGVLAARSNTFDALLKPLLDGMQTMPSFVYLVPVVMFFGIGNVPAVFATIIYAAPPTIRFTSLGIREVSPQVVEAARSFGTTPRQLLLKVQLPMALPTIMAGINQTTMMALAMMVIASLVGAGGLGEEVQRALSRARPGEALLGGLGIVFLAIIIDRITQAWAKSRQEALRM
ncbi:MAG: proline/glycine betaine ABC transporter permease [Chloroflexota bacterium]|nr:proline/glycine betaine ABC transporter permease [Chloroflexota bacterium]